MHNTAIPCGCLIEYEGDAYHQDYSIDFCPLHAAAPTLLTTLQLSLVLIERHRKFTQFDDDYFTVTAIEAAINAATAG